MSIQYERNGHYGIIQMSYKLANEIMPEAEIKDTTTMGELRDCGWLDKVRERLLLPESYQLLGVYLVPYQLIWRLLVQSPELPRCEEGAELPHVTPVYGRISKRYHEPPEPDEPYLIRIDIEPTTRVLRVD